MKQRITNIFSHWKSVMNHPRSCLDDKRRRVISAALKSGYTEDDLMQAITGCSMTPHNMGQNDNKQVYDAITLIFRSSDHIDRFIGNAEKKQAIPGAGAMAILNRERSI